MFSCFGMNCSTTVSYTHLDVYKRQVVHQAIADNKYLLLQGGMRLEVEEMQDTVYSCLLYTSTSVSAPPFALSRITPASLLRLL